MYKYYNYDKVTLSKFISPKWLSLVNYEHYRRYQTTLYKNFAGPKPRNDVACAVTMLVLIENSKLVYSQV